MSKFLILSAILCLSLPAHASNSVFVGELSIKLWSQLKSPDFQLKSGIKSSYVLPFPQVKAATFCEAIQVAKNELMNQPYQHPIRAILCDDENESLLESRDKNPKACEGQIEGGKLYSSERSILSTPELDTTIDGVILKEINSGKWIQSCLLGRKWHPNRRADIDCDDVKCP